MKWYLVAVIAAYLDVKTWLFL